MKVLDDTSSRWRIQLEDYADLVTIRAAGGNPVDGGTRSSAIANCPHCRRYYLITTTISPFHEARPEEYYL